MDLAEKIRKNREFRGMTQRKLGELCGFPTKSADSRIREFESGKKNPKQEILQKIADALNVSILDFLDIKLDRPADLEYLKKQGMQSPCKVGDILYEAEDGIVKSCIVSGIYLSPNISEIEISYDENDYPCDSTRINFNDIGKYFFFTPEEAEETAALQKKNENEINVRKNFFRGKKIHDGEWIAGYFIKYKRRYFIANIEPCFAPSLTVKDKSLWIFDLYSFEVSPKTVCQCTNVPDKNGKMIFRGDIIKRKLFGDEYVIGEVVWLDIGFCGFCLKCGNKYYPMGKEEHSQIACDDEIIGNIFDNPKLIEGDTET